MSIINRAALVALLCALAPTLAACSTDTKTITVADGDEMGTFVQRWTIEGSTDDDRCERFGADRMRVVLYDESGDVQATEFASCKSFELSVFLRAKAYKGSATFVGSGGDVVSASLPIERFTIAVHEETSRSLDFTAAQMGAAAQ